MSAETHDFPVALRVWGWCVLPGTWLVAAHLTWEATVLTAREGPQMIGFSFIHTSPLPVLVSAFLAQVWLLIGIPWTGYMLWRKEQLRMAGI